MKICEVTALLEQEGTWVRRNMKTRDHLLFGDDQQEVGRIGICWVASKGAILAAVKQKVNFIITHENPFYQCSTQMHTAAIKAAEEKKRILQEHGISVYRCHDVWDCIKEYGVADQWAFRLGFKFEERIVSSYYQAASIPEMTAEALAHHVAKVLRQDGEQGVYMFGDPQKRFIELPSDVAPQRIFMSFWNFIRMRSSLVTTASTIMMLHSMQSISIFQ